MFRYASLVDPRMVKNQAHLSFRATAHHSSLEIVEGIVGPLLADWLESNQIFMWENLGFPTARRLTPCRLFRPPTDFTSFDACSSNLNRRDVIITGFFLVNFFGLHDSFPCWFSSISSFVASGTNIMVK
jgi:hypothetical protein